MKLIAITAVFTLLTIAAIVTAALQATRLCSDRGALNELGEYIDSRDCIYGVEYSRAQHVIEPVLTQDGDIISCKIVGE